MIYNSLDEDVKQADISDIMRALQGVVDESIAIQGDPAADGNGLYDISKIDFERLKREFKRSPQRTTTVQTMRRPNSPAVRLVPVWGDNWSGGHRHGSTQRAF